MHSFTHNTIAKCNTLVGVWQARLGAVRQPHGRHGMAGPSAARHAPATTRQAGQAVASRGEAWQPHGRHGEAGRVLVRRDKAWQLSRQAGRGLACLAEPSHGRATSRRAWLVKSRHAQARCGLQRLGNHTAGTSRLG